MKLRQSLLFAAFLASASSASADNCEDGVRFYTQGNYQAAATCFDRCMRTPIRDPNIVYYAALNAQRLGQFDKARVWYTSLATRFPQTQAGKNSVAALRSLSSGTTSSPGETASLPRETWVPFKRAGSHLVLDVLINRKHTNMVFDTGADFSLLSAPMIAELGMSIPNRAPDGYSGGVGGKSKYSAIWKEPVDIQVGSIERRNFRVGMSQMPQQVALLGRDFLKGMEYTINDAESTITFKRSDAGSSTKVAKASAPIGPDGSVTTTGSGTYEYNVPFTTISANVIVVEAKLNGQPCKMIFDTGASVCFFTAEQALKVGLTVPADAPTTPIYGVGGNTTARMIQIKDFKLGPLDANNIIAAVGGSSVAPLPLMGQSFFKPYKYTIDLANKVIRFTKPTN